MNSNETERRWTRQERLASLTHRLANAGRTVRDQSTDLPVPPGTILADLSDLALGRYAAQWKGTTRGDAALAEITAREARGTLSPATLDALGIPAQVTVREIIRHGDYRHDGNATAPTLARAVAVLLNNSPYGNHTDEPVTSITADLTATGRAAYGWADYSIVA